MFKGIHHHSLYRNVFSELKKRRTLLEIIFTGLFFIFIQPGVYAQIHEYKHDHNPNTGNITSDSTSSKYIIIKEIILKGNEITRDKIIYREIGYKVGDTIPTEHLMPKLIWIKNRLFNTTLFLWVDIDLTGEDSVYKTLFIGFRERFYVTPMPTGGLADRNFNEWWQDRNHDLKRIYYGINLKIKNILGLNHTLRVTAYTGFNQKVEVNYQIPYLTKKLRTGLNITTSLSHNRQVAYRSYEHKLDYIESLNYGRRKYNIEALLSYRKKFYIQHLFGPYFQYTIIEDTIALLNPDYLLERATYQRSWGFKYSYTLDRRDFINYPLKGYYFKVEGDYQFLNSVKNLHVGAIRSEYTQFIPLLKHLYFAAGIRGKISTPQLQPYFSQRGLGYNKEIISGYELYVIDGQAYGLIKSNLRYRLLAVNPTIKFLPFRKFRTVPMSIYFKIYSDAGYVVDNTYNPYNNFLSNRLLVGGGAGIDFVSYYDIVARIEYSINQLGQTGVYLHLKAGL